MNGGDELLFGVLTLNPKSVSFGEGEESEARNARNEGGEETERDEVSSPIIERSCISSSLSRSFPMSAPEDTGFSIVEAEGLHRRLSHQVDEMELPLVPPSPPLSSPHSSSPSLPVPPHQVERPPVPPLATSEPAHVPEVRMESSSPSKKVRSL